MSQRIKIGLLNQSGKRQIVSIFRRSLSNYKKTKWLHNGRSVWSRPDILKKLYSRRGIGQKIYKGISHLTNRKYARYEFSLWRKKLRDEDDLNRIMKGLRRRFDKIRKNNRNLSGQRLGITAGTSDRHNRLIAIKHTIKHHISGKLFQRTTYKKIEDADTISTITYDRDDVSTDMMFIELMEKMREIFLQKQGYTLDMTVKSEIEILKFYVFYTQ